MGLRVLLLLLAVFHGASARRTRVQEQEFKEALLRGVRLSTSGDQRAALEAFEAAAALAPGDPAALQNVGVMAMQLGDATRAASAFEAALAATPTNPAGLLSGLGQALLQLGRGAEAVRALRASVAAETDPTRRAQWAANLATALRALGDTSGGRAAEVEARPASAEQADAWQRRADVLLRSAAAHNGSRSASGCPSLTPPLPELVTPALDARFPACERVPASEVSPQQFVERYVRASVPVVLTGALAGSLVTPEALIASAGHEVLPVSLAFPSGVTHRVLPASHADVVAALGPSRGAWTAKVAGTPAQSVAVLRAPQSRMRLATFLQLLRTRGAPPLYAHQLPADMFLPSVLNSSHVGVAWAAGAPDDGPGSPLPPPPIASALVPMAAPHAWLTGSAATGLHFDRGDNLLALLAGSKRVLLLRPSQAKRLRYSPATDVTAGSAGAGTLVSDNHALEDAFLAPGMQSDGSWAGGAVGSTCAVEAGEMLFIPYRWHHAVLTTPSTAPDCWSVALNWWFTPLLSDAQALAAHEEDSGNEVPASGSQAPEADASGDAVPAALRSMTEL